MAGEAVSIDPRRIRTYAIPARLLESTRLLLAEPGRKGYEATVVWVARPTDETAAEIVDVRRPHQLARRSDYGVSVEVTEEGMTQLISALTPGTFLAARIHTHPIEAYHSEVDDLNMLIGHEGAISIVVPYFAEDPIDLLHCSVNELRTGAGWVVLTPKEVSQRFLVR